MKNRECYLKLVQQGRARKNRKLRSRDEEQEKI